MKENTINAKNMTKDKLYGAMVNAYNETKGRFSVTLANGDTACVRAFEYTPNHENCEWFFVTGTNFPYADDDSLAKLAEFFANYISELEARNREITKLRAYEADLAAINEKDSEEYREMFGFYSDWYKDLFGRRPRHRP